jgi:NAD(P)-dependent dehydrogenase (short-subunit alcohol dehydrogenase family)
MLDVNLKGSFLVAQAVARKMVADGTKGVIVNISSSSVRGHALGGALFGQQERHHSIARSMALALAPHGIRINAIEWYRSSDKVRSSFFDRHLSGVLETRSAR